MRRTEMMKYQHNGGRMTELTRGEKLRQTMIRKHGSEEAWKKAMQEQGRRGGITTGDSKRREAEHYRRIGRIGGLNRGKSTKV